MGERLMFNLIDKVKWLYVSAVIYAINYVYLFPINSRNDNVADIKLTKAKRELERYIDIQEYCVLGSSYFALGFARGLERGSVGLNALGINSLIGQ